MATAMRDSKGRFIKRAAVEAAVAVVAAVKSVATPRFDSRQKFQTHEFVSPKQMRKMNKRGAPVALTVFA